MAPKDKTPIVPWFPQAKFGIFLHWGIYAVGAMDASWPFYFGHLSYRDYLGQKERFKAERYDPRAWARLFKRAGARYAVLTSKHHDGFALWDSHYGNLDAKRHSPAGRDLVGPWVKAMRAEGLKAGLYFSLLDWSHPDYASVKSAPSPNTASPAFAPGAAFSYAQGKEDPRAWARFLKDMNGQLEELQRRYHPDLLWFDGDWERSPAQWRASRLRAALKRRNPKVVLNSRLGGRGDYGTPEQAVPIFGPRGVWEFCMTLNRTWGYTEGGYKPLRELLRILTETAGLGGNLLLNVGPKADGTLPKEAVQRLEGMGAWLRRNGDSIYGTQAGLPAGYYYGASTLSPDRKKLYLFVYDRPRGELAVKGLRSGVRAASLLHSGRKLKFRWDGGAPWMGKPGQLRVQVPGAGLEKDVSVVKLELEKPLDLYDDRKGVGHEA